MLVARRLTELSPLAVSSSHKTVMRVLQRTMSDKPEDTKIAPAVKSETSGVTVRPDPALKPVVNKKENIESEILKIVKENDKVTGYKKHEDKLFFTNEEKAMMRNPDQRIPYTVEKEPGTEIILKY